MSELNEIGRTLEREVRTDDLGARAEQATLRFKQRADQEGLVEVAYAQIDAPLGPMLLAATPRGLVRVALPAEGFDWVLEDLADSVSPRVLEWPARLDEARRELEQYFAGERTRFDVPLDWRMTGAGFSRRVLRATARVPYGVTTTYSEVAAEAGSPRGQRAAGNALGSNPIPIVVPCHRVLRTGGSLGGYGGGPEMKEFLLRLEGAIGA